MKFMKFISMSKLNKILQNFLIKKWFKNKSIFIWFDEENYNF